ncbi:MAG: GvpL/GvpF family gas vesicle protein [Acidobacteria bacterium]|nr:GvpL/GvpF family gas vesicle protein [Acidobacteriota bacterium]
MASSPDQQRASYVYGILPEDIELSSGMTGVGDPPGRLRVVRSDDLAALVSDVDPARPLGSPDDLRAHKDILDSSAAEVPVLPLRFGAVLASDDAVAKELLQPFHDEFSAALDQLDGLAEYVVKGRYVGPRILEEVLSENSQAQRLREEIRDKDPNATRDVRIQLGEFIADAISAKREKDTDAVQEAMADHCTASFVREPAHEEEAVNVAFLVDGGQQQEMEKTVEELARKWEGRVELRVLGPMAAYDFVGTTQRGG